MKCNILVYIFQLSAGTRNIFCSEALYFCEVCLLFILPQTLAIASISWSLLGFKQ